MLWFAIADQCCKVLSVISNFPPSWASMLAGVVMP